LLEPIPERMTNPASAPTAKRWATRKDARSLLSHFRKSLHP
jgi:hypothetical protein